MSRMNYVFVDFENVQETDWDRITHKQVKVVVMLGTQQHKLPVPLVKKLMRHGSHVQLVETRHPGRNALDLVLAHYVGAIRVTDPEGCFYIVSKDKGFDSLIGHLRDTGTPAWRYNAFSEIPMLMRAEERVSYISARLKQTTDSRPIKRKKLESKIRAAFGKTLSENEIAETIECLVREQAITILDLDDVKKAA